MILKRADESPAVPAIDPDLAGKLGDPRNLIRVQHLRNLGVLGIGALGLGAAFAGARALSGQTGENLSKAPGPPARQDFVPIPLPRSQFQQPDRRRSKLAAGPLVAVARAAQAAYHEKQGDGPVDPGQLRPGDLTAGKIMDYVGGLKDKLGQNWGPGKQFTFNYGASQPWNQGYMYAAVPAVIGGAGYLGYKGMGALLGPTQKAERESELDRAQKRYMGALMGKTARAQALDRAYDRFEKRGGEGNALWDALSPAAGLYGAALLGTGAGVGKLTYDWLQRHSNQKVMEDALKRRRELLFASSPPAIVAMPVGTGSEDEPERRAIRALPKFAGIAGAADEVLGRFDSRRRAIYDQMAAMQGAKPDTPAKPAKPTPPAPPQLPSVVNNRPGG